jgi:pre-mRNA-splicing factor ATP-dependent RNA helicase DHX15/PRP43
MERKRKIDFGESTKFSKRKPVNLANDVNPWTGNPFSARFYSILNTRQKLPVYQFKDKLIECVKENQIVVVEGETGSGKTTQVNAENRKTSIHFCILNLVFIFILS